MKHLFMLLCIGFHFQVMGQVTILNEKFTSCSPALPSGWSQYNVTGSDIWSCTSSGFGGNGVFMNGYSSSTWHTNEDWLITPWIDLGTYQNPVLEFKSRTQYAGDSLQLLLSTNYPGAVNPNGYSWQNLHPEWPFVYSDQWFSSGPVSLKNFTSSPFYLGFRYTSTTSSAAYWRLDNVQIREDSLQLQNLFFNLNECYSGTYTPSKTTTFTVFGNYTQMMLSVSAPFELSLDNINFSNQLNIPTPVSGIAQNLYIRMFGAAPGKVYHDSIQFTLDGHTQSDLIYLLGSTLPDESTLRVAQWNMRWWGDEVNCTCNTTTAFQLGAQVLKDLHADLYAIQEVVDTASLHLLAQQLGPSYQAMVSSFCSFAATSTDPNYSEGQKLGFIYNTNKLSPGTAYGLLASTLSTDTSASSGYYCFSSGRFPWVLPFKVHLANSSTDSLIAVNLHAKAMSDITSYNRRQCGAQKMADSLNALYSGKNILVLGDYNDYLEGSDVSGMTISPYDYLLQHGFTGITLPSLFPGQTTYVGSSNHMLDNLCISNGFMSRYADSSCFIFSEATRYISNYGIRLSDHIPVMSYYSFPAPNAVTTLSTPDTELHVVQQNGILRCSVEANSSDAVCELLDLQGRILKQVKIVSGQKEALISISGFAQSMYLVRWRYQQNQKIVKVWLQ